MQFRFRNHRPLLASVLTLLTLALAACARAPEFRGQDVTGLMPDLAFELTGEDGERTTPAAYPDKVTLMYFGFTSCPDLCPTTLSQLKAALAALGEEARDVQVFLVSVDPDRDTPQALTRYTESFGPWLHGFTGNKRELKALNHAYKVDFLAQEARLNGTYDVMHSNRVFGFDRRGRCRVLMPNTANTEAMVADLRQLLAL